MCSSYNLHVYLFIYNFIEHVTEERAFPVKVVNSGAKTAVSKPMEVLVDPDSSTLRIVETQSHKDSK